MDYLDTRMREIREAGKVTGIERVAMMAAINITHELLSLQLGQGTDVGQVKHRLRALTQVIDEAMAGQADLF